MKPFARTAILALSSLMPFSQAATADEGSKPDANAEPPFSVTPEMREKYTPDFLKEDPSTLSRKCIYFKTKCPTKSHEPSPPA